MITIFMFRFVAKDSDRLLHYVGIRLFIHLTNHTSVTPVEKHSTGKI